MFPRSRPPFAAVLLAGGRSRRMGTDKAMLDDGRGRPLWRRQWELLASLDPAEMILSCRPAQELPGSDGLRRIDDADPEGGPLAAVAGVLEAVTSPQVLVLAVDLPRMTASVLHRLLEHCRDTTDGAVFVRDNGLYEPLAAVYPASLAASAREHLAAGRRAMQSWVAAAISSDALARVAPQPADHHALFNLNDPAALAAWRSPAAGPEADPPAR